MNIEKSLEVAIKAAMSAGKILNENYKETIQTNTKESNRDVVTEIDKIAESNALDILKSFDSKISIISEEHGDIGGSTDLCWVVDALDGTVNYLHQVPFFCVSIALIQKNNPVIGVIYSPLFDEIYYGAENIGVFKNQKKINVHDKQPTDSLFTVSFSGKNYDPQRRNEEFIMFAEINDSTRGCLRTGSAALNLAYLAEGKFGGCWGKANKLWDISAGLVIAKLAGAHIFTQEVDVKKHLANYIAAPQQNFEFLKNKATKIFIP